MLKLNEDNERGITKKELDSFKAWDVQYVPEWAIPYECKMIKNGFEPSDFNYIRWYVDMQGDGEYEYEVDPDPVPAFCWNPSFGYACNVYPVIYIKK